jgi:tryptophan synthase alpha chain
LASRACGRIQIIPFINVADPSLDSTFGLLEVLAELGVEIVELCLPFPRSISDGPAVRASHQRALVAGPTLSDLCRIVVRAKSELKLRCVVLADYRHSVRPLGFERFLGELRDAHACATLIHDLPAALRQQYLELSERNDLGRIMTLFCHSVLDTRHAAFMESRGYAYVVSGFGRTGRELGKSASLLASLRAIRDETTRPLALGFGLKSWQDVAFARDAGADAAIMGSAIAALIAEHVDDRERMLNAIRAFFATLSRRDEYGGLRVNASRSE